MGIEVNSERRDVSVAVSNELRAYARTRWPLANDKFRKTRLASLIGVTERRIKSLWEGDPAAVLREHEAAAIRKLHKQRQIEEANRNDFAALQDRVARLEAALLAVDEEFHQPALAGLRGALAGGRGKDVAGVTDADPTDYSD